MLILARKVDERIVIGDQIEIAVVDIKGDQVKLGIQAPPNIKVYRHEVYDAIQKENVAAANAAPGRIPEIPTTGALPDDGPTKPPASELTRPLPEES